MAYLIGNTTVISNTGALGSVDGNSLNLANNNNLSAGGASFQTVSNSQNTTVAGSTFAYLFCVGGGGGGAAAGVSPSGTYSIGGYAGVCTMSIIDVSGGGNATYTIGSGGNGGSTNPAPATGGNPGGTTNFSYPGANLVSNNHNTAAGGSRAGSNYSGATVPSMNPLQAFFNVRMNTGYGPNSNNLAGVDAKTGYFSPFGQGGNYNGAGTAGCIKILGF